MTIPLYTNTALRLVKRAYMETGLLELGADPNSEQLAIGMERLNDLINVWQTQGLRLWVEEDLAIPLIANQYLYPLTQVLNGITSKPLRVKEGYFLYTPGNPSGQTMYPLIPMARNDWDTVGTRNSPGTVTSYYADKQPSVLNINLWQAPSVSFATQGQVHLIIQQQQTNSVQLTDQMVFPQEWFLALLWGLADELAGGQPQSIMDRCTGRALQYRTALENWDVEDAPTQFQPDSRMQYGNQGRFM